jgi:hypothetical protein
MSEDEVEAGMRDAAVSAPTLMLRRLPLDSNCDRPYLPDALPDHSEVAAQNNRPAAGVRSRSGRVVFPRFPATSRADSAAGARLASLCACCGRGCRSLGRAGGPTLQPVAALGLSGGLRQPGGPQAGLRDSAGLPIMLTVLPTSTTAPPPRRLAEHRGADTGCPSDVRRQTGGDDLSDGQFQARLTDVGHCRGGSRGLRW